MVLMAFFTYFLGNIVHYDEVVLMNNIFRDLFIGTVMMYAIDLFTEGKNTGSWKKLLQVFSYSFYQSCSHYLSRCYFLVLLFFKTKLFLC